MWDVLLAPLTEFVWGFLPERWSRTLPVWARVILIPLSIATALAIAVGIVFLAVAFWALINGFASGISR